MINHQVQGGIGMDKELFIDRLRVAMKNKSISQYTLSKLSGINRGTISSYMSGKYLPKQDKIFILADILEVNPEWLACNSNSMERISSKLNDYLEDSPHINSYPYVDAGVSAGLANEIEAQHDLDLVNIPDLLLGRYAGRKYEQSYTEWFFDRTYNKCFNIFSIKWRYRSLLL